MVALEDSLLHQCAHRLAQRHVADADLDGELPFGRQDGAAREIADPDLLCDPLSGHIRLRHALFIHHGTTPVVFVDIPVTTPPDSQISNEFSGEAPFSPTGGRLRC